MANIAHLRRSGSVLHFDFPELGQQFAEYRSLRDAHCCTDPNKRGRTHAKETTRAPLPRGDLPRGNLRSQD